MNPETNSETKYTKEHLLGKGSYAKVFSGKDSNGNQVALKEFRNGGKMNSRLKKSAKNEVNILSKCDQKNIVKYLDAYIDKNRTILVMEHARTILSEIISEPYVATSSFIRKYLKDLASGLNYLHNKRKVIHMDLKPENILIFPNPDSVDSEELNNAIDEIFLDILEGQDLTDELQDELDYLSSQKMDEIAYLQATAKICDFSISVPIEDQEFVEGWMCGTLWYRAPECLINQDEGSVTPAVDIWALGCVVYEMCAGRALFVDTKYEEETLEKIRDLRDDKSKFLKPILEIDPDVAGLVEKMLEFQPERRITAEELVEALKNLED